MKIKIILSPVFYAICCCICFNSCKPFVEIESPITQTINSTVFTNDGTALSAIRGIYSEMAAAPNLPFSGGNQSVSALAAISADEFIELSNAQDRLQFSSNRISPSNTILLNGIWSPIYKYIYYANSVIEGATSSKQLSPQVKNQLIGEARFIRAYCHFYLVNLFGNIPLVTTTDYRINNIISRTPEEQVYSGITGDLLAAQELLSQDYSSSNNERVRPVKWAATALLARVYLYTHNWSKAESSASEIINNTALYQLQAPKDVFLKNSTETIWQLMPVIPGYNTFEGKSFVPFFEGGVLALNPNFPKAFEKDDLRKIAWIDSLNNSGSKYYFPSKYKVKLSAQPLSEYTMMLRIAEQYLIRAEARAEINNLDGAINDLNQIRQKAGLQPTAATQKAEILLAIEQERKVELFGEWGHRWFDLKRTNRAEAILKPIKGNSWTSSSLIFPIPESEIKNNTNLNPQNNGY